MDIETIKGLGIVAVFVLVGLYLLRHKGAVGRAIAAGRAHYEKIKAEREAKAKPKTKAKPKAKAKGDGHGRRR